MNQFKSQKIVSLTSKSSYWHMEMTKIPPAVVNCLWHIRQQLTASRFDALKGSFNGDFTRFGWKIKINQKLFRILQNFTDPLYILFLELSAKKPAQNSISRSTFWCFGFLNYWRIKNSYLIHSLSKNLNFLWEMFFYVLNMCGKNNEKIQPLYNFFGRAVGKILQFYAFQ